jgi:hypothetical protein
MTAPREGREEPVVSALRHWAGRLDQEAHLWESTTLHSAADRIEELLARLAPSRDAGEVDSWVNGSDRHRIEAAWAAANKRVGGKVEGSYGPYTNVDWHHVVTIMEGYETLRQAALRQPEQDAGEAVVKQMAERFLSWRLPETFNPDGGISFEPVHSVGTPHEARRQPVGTNLFTYTEALAMVRHMVEGLPAAPHSSPVAQPVAWMRKWINMPDESITTNQQIAESWIDAQERLGVPTNVIPLYAALRPRPLGERERRLMAVGEAALARRIAAGNTTCSVDDGETGYVQRIEDYGSADYQFNAAVSALAAFDADAAQEWNDAR